MTVQGNVLGFPILSLIAYLPLAGVILLLMIGREQIRNLRNVAFVASLVTFVVSLPLVFSYDQTTPAVQFVERASWIPSIGVTYFFGLDGISLWLVMLTTFLSPIAILCSFESIKHRAKEYYIFMLVLETGMLGVFLALDFFLFYVFWEVMLVPMYFLIGVWGSDRRLYSAIKFFLYTLFGSVVMLLGILAIYFYAAGQTGTYTFDVLELMRVAYPGAPVISLLGVSLSFQDLVWLSFALSFAIKVPMFPFHTWLPDAHTDAPTAGSVILAGVLLKMGTFGFFRYALPLLPEAALHYRPAIAILAVIGIVYGALMCFVQKDMKRLVAYSSVSHLGFVMLGLMALTAEGLTGGVYQMLNHGVSTGALFLLVGILYERRHTRLISEYGGIARQVPWIATAFVIVTLSSIGLPGTNGFVGEFLILSGTWVGRLVKAPWFAAVAATGVILGAVYMLLLVEKVFFGTMRNEKNAGLPDFSVREWFVMAPLLVLIFVMGLKPQPFLDPARAPVNRLLGRFAAAEQKMNVPGRPPSTGTELPALAGRE